MITMYNKKYTLMGIGIALVLSSLSFAQAGRMFFDPATFNVVNNCPTAIPLYMDTQGESTLAIDVKLFGEYDDLEVIGFDMSGGAFSGYLKPQFATAVLGQNKGKKMLQLFAANDITQNINGLALVGNLIIKNKKPIATSTIQVYALSGVQSEDSNIAVISGGNAIDTLKEGNEVVIRFVDGTCASTPTQGSNIINMGSAGEQATLSSNPTFVPKKAPGISTNLIVTSSLILLLIIIIIILITNNRKKKEEKKKK